ncbi:DNA polymerase IV [Aurantimonas sp. Leaf443]|uniref:DNA polymerase IV n=1 Tax=Aurantimonas sp. Leaf443 TaxID=1736378 RepID=UPI0006F3078C|nr:DNA polymerase IV [Aurantimonas sp. Leaf443]KQT86304.1 DNA polymerase IV [Aurantimonas sp. Leaf443]
MSAAPRKIIHVDMDAYYASVEQRDDPSLRGVPVAVGGSSERGVVAAASYEARRFGVRSAMPSSTARRRCPDLVFVKPRFEVYKAISRHIRSIFARYTDLIEPLSLDEAYLDVTENKLGCTSATEIAAMIRADIRAETELTASAGVSYNKFLAKLACEQKKPDGLFVIAPSFGPTFVEDLGVGKFHGVGPATERRMNEHGIFRGRDLRALSLEALTQRFGKAGAYYYGIARGIDERPVRANRIRKSLGAETTFNADLHEGDEMRAALRPLIEKVTLQCAAQGIAGRAATLKVKFSDFRIATRSRTCPGRLVEADAVETVVHSLLEPLLPVKKGVRLLGVTISALERLDDAPLSQLALPL